MIITYYWPPAGGPGVQRWLKFVKYLPESGIEPIVYIPENPTYAIEDETLLDKVPEGVTVLKRPIFEPYRFAELLSKKSSKTISRGIIANPKKQSVIQRLLLFIRGNFFIPDARKFWVKPSVKWLKSYIEENAISTVITTGPPHSVHLIGLGLKKQLGVQWISDFRDPWTSIGYHNKLKLTTAAQKKHKQLERLVLSNSDHVVVTSFTTKKEFEQLTDTPVTTITNGYDNEVEVNISFHDKFTIAHIGSLLSERNPHILWKALQELTQENELFRKAFRLHLIGAVSDDVLASIKSFGLEAFVTNTGYVSHNEAIIQQKSSQLLLLIEIDADYTKGIIPGKIFEYMASGRPVIAIGPEDADIKKIIDETGIGYFYTYKDFQILKQQLLTYFNAYDSGKLVSNTSRQIEKYSRKTLTNTLASIINKVNQ
ncbi:glycosyltransferase family 4 protein [Aquimarina brevivitae]|uniref:glycosyltransferase family 4 protein n=1 Tax=Aquimarina brevivitae TaxID=323412 RepID=UPI0030FE4E79